MNLIALTLLNLIFLLFCLIYSLPATVSAEDQKSLTLQIHPYLPASELLERFSPLEKYLSEKTKIKTTCTISKNYREHIEIVGQDRADLAYMGPASYVIMTQKYGQKPVLARLEINGTPLFRGVIVARENSSVRALHDLAGKSFAFGDPNSTMSYFVPLSMLRDAGIGIDALAKYSFLTSHKNVALGVLMGNFDAGAVKEEVFFEFKDRGLKDLAWSPKISEHLFVASTALPQTMVDTIRNALLTLDDKRILTAIKSDVSALVPVADSDYDNLRMILLKLDQTDR